MRKFWKIEFCCNLIAVSYQYSKKKNMARILREIHQSKKQKQMFARIVTEYEIKRKRLQ